MLHRKGTYFMVDKKYACLKLDNQLCFPLYACSREVVKLYTPYLNELGLTYTQYVTMMVMWEHRSLTVKEAGTLLHLDSGTLTPLFKKLEEKGLVSRNRSQTDERNLIVSVTEKGEALRERAVEVPAKLDSCMKLTPEEAQQLYGLLYKLLKTLE